MPQKARFRPDEAHKALNDIKNYGKDRKRGRKRGNFMAFFNQAISTLSVLVIAIGAGLGVWGAVNLLEGYGSDNPGAKSQGIKQLMSGGGIILIGVKLIPMLSGLFS
ncbi:Maff2 family protein [Peptoanaerobacter stomatis]|uniref:Maff2 family protein n=2 Tax=Peptostreptococcales TaxID=3082720 RepID=J6HII9_9FIRM|nr:Maff2 family protein [Peptoanaerobacter stomatis]